MTLIHSFQFDVPVVGIDLNFLHLLLVLPLLGFHVLLDVADFTHLFVQFLVLEIDLTLASDQFQFHLLICRRQPLQLRAHLFLSLVMATS